MSGEASTSQPAETALAVPSESASVPGPGDDDLLKAFFSDLRDVDRDNEVNRIMWSFKLNPFERLNLPFDASVEEVKKQYRKLSLMVHPDKCKHPQAAAAFDILGEAQKDLLNDDKREALLKLLDVAREEVRKEVAKEKKKDNVTRLASMLHDSGREGVLSEYEQTPEFKEKWKLKAREYLAQSAWRTKKLAKRLKDETSRVEQEEEENREKAKHARKTAQEWEKTRDERVGTWRDFVTKKGGKTKSVGELKPPKLKTNDEEKLYVQRPVGEQFRPPPQKQVGHQGRL